MGRRVWNKLLSLWEKHGWQSMLGHLSHTLAPERLGPSLTERIFWRADTDEPVVALSFDDGPHPTFTPRLLDILAKHEVPATFFLIGRYVKKHPHIAERIAADRHEIGNHTYHHRIMPLLPGRMLEHEIRTTHQLILDATGREAQLLRPPMGLFTRRTVDVTEACGYKTVVGDVYPRDPNLPGTERIVRRVLRRTRPGSLIILHDGGNTRVVDRSQTLTAVDRIIPELKRRGYRFVTLSKLIEKDKLSESIATGDS